jgi:RNA polymerase sigma-70 factor (ECF subfamily)
MDHERLVRLAGGGDVRAFVELTKRFEHFAFGSALALIHDFQQAEDVVQESFLAAWSALPSLADPAAFPGWLRGIVRHHAFRVLRRRRPETLPLSHADQVPNEEAAPDEQLGHRQQAAAALAAIAALPASLREPAMLFFVHECSHQDIATFLNLPVATVNNRLHAARTQLKERILTMTQTLQTHGLPDDFANRIGRLIEARGSVVDALFDPAGMPDILAELAVSDEANRRAVNVQVVQRRGAGIVRGIADSPIDALPRGSTVLNSGHHARTPFNAAQFEQMVRLLVGPTSGTAGLPKFLETGIKVIDVMCPLVAGGTLAIATDIDAGVMVMMEELVRRLSGGCDPLSIFVMMPPPPTEWPYALEPEPGFSHAEQLRKEGYSEGTVGAVQTFFLRAEEGPWTTQRLATLAPADVVIRMSRERGQAKIYPTVDVLASRSRLLEMKEADAEHVAIAEQVREALASLWATPSEGKSCDDKSCDGHVLFERALKVQNYFTQPFFCAEPYTNRSGASVSAVEALRTCAEILDGQHDGVPVEAFYFSGGMAEIMGNTGRTLTFGPVTR